MTLGSILKLASLVTAIGLGIAGLCQSAPNAVWRSHVGAVDIVDSLQFSEDDSTVFASSWDVSTISAWRVSDGQCIGTYAQSDGITPALVDSALRGHKLVGSSSAWCGIWDLLTGHTIFGQMNDSSTNNEGSALSTATHLFLVSRYTYVSGNTTSRVFQYDAETGALQRTHGPYAGRLSRLAAHPVGFVYAVVRGTDSVEIRETFSGQRLRSVGAQITQDVLRPIVFSESGSRLITVGSAVVGVYDWQLGVRISYFNLAPDFKRCLSPNGDWLVSDVPGAVNLYRVSDGALITTRPYTGQSHQAFAFSHDGSKLAVADRRGVIEIWDTLTLQPIRTMDSMVGHIWYARWLPQTGKIVLKMYPTNRAIIEESGIRDVSMPQVVADQVEAESPNGSQYALISGTQVRIVRSDNYEVIHELSNPEAVSSCFWSQDGSKFLTYSPSAPVTVWNTANWNVERQVTLPSGTTMLAAACSPENSRIALLVSPDQMLVYDLSTGLQVSAWVPLISVYGMPRLAFSYDGSRLISTGHETGNKVWDVASGTELSVYREPGFAPYNSTMLGDGIHVTSVARSRAESYEFQIHMWNIYSGNITRRVRTGVFAPECKISKDGLRAILLTGGAMKVVALESVSGVLTLSGYSHAFGPATIPVPIQQYGVTVEQVQATLLKYGAYRFLCNARGSAEFYIKWRTGLRKRVQVTLAQDQPVFDLNVTLTNGDVDDDNEVGPGDFEALSASYGALPGDPSWNERADLNGDGEVSAADYSILTTSFGRVGD